MNERKQLVVKYAHQLFIEKGYQATSIQDILDYSGISKGTFYNYFSSKSELLKAVFLTSQEKFEKERNELLIGQNLADIEIFIKQSELQMHSNKSNKLFSLYEEVMISNDTELKNFITHAKFQHIHWLSKRFLDIFGVDKKPYILDCAILYSGMMYQTIHFNALAKEPDFNPTEVIRYCVDRIKSIFEDVSKSNAQLLEPDLIKQWLPECFHTQQDFHTALLHSANDLKKMILRLCQDDEAERVKNLKLIHFIQEELLQNVEPRIFLIESALLSLNTNPKLKNTLELSEFEKIIANN
ncbi:helix-turn-helix domain-containing protein [Peribacillus simplex]|uniref:Helix-turn-helix domain-containing protein n=2 Tax=Peribacillus TaxID=2675229 RepID=A0AA90T0F8_9BACI|nr:MULTISPECIES: helix-turn-helix domain-containing protein [Peribacillus]MDP1417103.1 helix-turn-helix domain-containing protein [Peribacillus simplex]MDP1449758.1 helix-turn-helix domain-containing protein [Peribacillus frigoritolerans]